MYSARREYVTLFLCTTQVIPSRIHLTYLPHNIRRNFGLFKQRRSHATLKREPFRAPHVDVNSRYVSLYVLRVWRTHGGVEGFGGGGG